jgi:hypothetical protein
LFVSSFYIHFINETDGVVKFVVSNKASSHSSINNASLQAIVLKAKNHVGAHSLSLATVNSSAGFYRISMAVHAAGGHFEVSFDDITRQVTVSITLPIEVCEGQVMLGGGKDLTNVAMKEPVIDDGAVEDGPSSSEMELETTMVSKSSHDRTEEASKKPTEKVRERLSVVTHNLYCVYSRIYCTL